MGEIIYAFLVSTSHTHTHAHIISVVNGREYFRFSFVLRFYFLQQFND